MPLLRLGRAVRDARDQGLDQLGIKLTATDKKALTDIPEYCQTHGLVLQSLDPQEGGFTFVILYRAADYTEPIL